LEEAGLMKKKWFLIAFSILAFAAVVFAGRWWIPAISEFGRVHKDGIQTLCAVLAVVIGLVGVIVTIIVFRMQEATKRSDPADPARQSRQTSQISESSARRDMNLIQVQGDYISGAPRAPLDSTVPHEIPAPPTDFTGRESVLQELLATAEQGGVIVSGMRGMGGIGKTALAFKLAEHLAPRFPDGQLYVDLKGTNDRPVCALEAQAHVIRAFDRTADISEKPDEVRGLYLSTLNGKRALLLMDNAFDGRQIMPLVPPSSCGLLVTSRHNFKVPGLTLRNLAALSTQEAHDLLLKIEPRLGHDADEIAELCGYLPLALRAAASLLAVTPGLSPQVYAARLKEERNRISEIGTEGVEIGVEASLVSSYELLADGPALALRQMAIFPGEFDAEAEAAVCQDSDGRYLAELERRSLIQLDQKSGRYRLHDLVRLFAAKKLDDPLGEAEERARASLRYAEHYVKVLLVAEELFDRGGHAIKQGLEVFDTEWGNIQAGQAWTAASCQRGEDAAKACSDFADAWSLLGLRLHPRHYLEVLEQALGAARKLGRRDAEARHLGNMGTAYKNLGEYRRAIDYHENHLAIASEIGDQRGKGQALGNLGIAYKNLGECQMAIDYLEKCLAIAREIGDRRGEGRALGNLGNAYDSFGAYRRAIDYHKLCLAILREVGDQRGEGQALGNLGSAYYSLGEYRRAIDYQEQRLANAREIGIRRGEGIALGNLGLAYDSIGEYRQAVGYHEQYLAIAREIGDRLGEGNALFNTGLALHKLGEREKAILYGSEALKIYEEIEAPHAPKVRSKLAEWRAESGGPA
jgi:tetratricopeptide (TPR) repeat protein